jgi:potassium efflux system protein
VKFKPLLLLLLLVCLPAIGQDLRISGIAATDDVTIAEVDSMIDAITSREDLDDETRTQVLDFLREARAQLQIRLDNELAAQQFTESLNTAPAELEELRATLNEPTPESPTAESLGIDDGTTLDELQQSLATETASLTASESQLANLTEQVEVQIGRPAAARERISQLGVSRQELAVVASAQPAPGETQIATN